ncbi:MAG TPA: lysophospholipid acyltransferase family protein [Tepidisphaeraceae bacterium]|nr:lysophospholipid acyltransferase family protein [Tepidisphaeraceae bacterium]
MIAAGLIRLFTGAQARWVGVDPVGPDGAVPQRIYFANHCSNLDAPVIWASLPPAMRRRTRPVAARDYWDKNPVRRHLANNVFRCVLIERKHVSRRDNPLADMEAALDAGDSLILFPEGTRTTDDDGEMNDFKPGLWHLAKRHPAAQLVPVHLENCNRILPKGEFLLIPLLAAVTFGTPVRIEDGEDKQTFLGRAKRAVAGLHAAEERA